MDRKTSHQENYCSELCKSCVKLWRSRGRFFPNFPCAGSGQLPHSQRNTVSNRILIVEHPQSPPCCGGDQAVYAPEWKNARRASWDNFSPEALRAMKDSLVIANAVPCGAKITEFFHWLRRNPVSVPVFAILPADDGALLQVATETADDFLIWPVRPEELKTRIARLLGPDPQDLTDIQTTLAAEIGLGQLVGQDPAFLSALAQVSLFGSCDAPVLLTGETGTGKELCARVTHLLSKRHRGPFIPIDCGALPDHLFENEVFGHARGAFTDARSDQKGLVSLAQGGTLFLDEIDSLSLAAQSKVLRLLQERTYRPLGSEVFKLAEVRIIAATNRSLEELVEKKVFRSDLYFRINVLRIRMPALRERRSDIAILCRHFIDEICKANDIPKKVLSPAASSKLEQYSWPGNVRELYNTMQRAVLCSPGTQIAASILHLDLPGDGAGTSVYEAACKGFRSAKLHAIQRFEREYVKQMMEKHNGNITQAAREARKDRRSFGRLAQKYRVISATE
jgi:DNA-binding NtrC family response regulator